MEEDIEISLSPVRKSQPKQGRRAGPTGHNDGDLEEANVSMSNLRSRPVTGDLFTDDNNKGQASAGPPTHGRRTGGWADETSRAKTAKSMRFMDNGPEVGGFGKGDDSDDDAIPIIPDLDDVRDEDMQLQVADAPSVAVNRVATYKELDSDLLKNVAFATLDDIDLRLLTKCLAPESALKETDENWNWDVVFAQVSGELHKEWYSEGDKDPENMIPPPIETNTQIDIEGPGTSNRITKERPYTAFNRFPV